MEATACKQATKTTAAAILAAGAMIAAAVYFKPMPGRFTALDDKIGVRLDTTTGSYERCGQAAVGGRDSIDGIPDSKLRAFRFEPTGYRADQFDEAFGQGAASKALEGTTIRVVCTAWEEWPGP